MIDDWFIDNWLMIDDWLMIDWWLNGLTELNNKTFIFNSRSSALIALALLVTGVAPRPWLCLKTKVMVKISLSKCMGELFFKSSMIGAI